RNAHRPGVLDLAEGDDLVRHPQHRRADRRRARDRRAHAAPHPVHDPALARAGALPRLQRGRRDRVPVDPRHAAGHLQHLPAVARLRPGRLLGPETWVIPTVALVNVWRHMGYTALLLFAGLQSIPSFLYEAARTEGAGEIAMFRRITLPLLRPILALVLIMTIIGSFQVFDTVSVTTQGGPADASKVLQMYIYENAFGQYQFGYASALSVALLLILMVITFAQYRMSNAGQSDLD